MSSNGMGVIGGLLTALTGLDRVAGAAKGKLEDLRMAAIGVGVAFAAWKTIEGIAHVINASKELNNELAKTKQLGGEFAKTIPAQRAAAFAASFAVPTMAPSEAVKMLRETGVTLNSPAEAMEILQAAAKTAYVISHFTGENAEDISKNLVRTADIRGQIYKTGPDGEKHLDPAALAVEMEAAAKGLILGGGFLKSNDLLQMVRQGGLAVKNMSVGALYGALVEAAVALGPSKTGTALTGLFQQFVGGTMRKNVAEHLSEAGYFKPGDWKSGKSGAVVMTPQAAARFKGAVDDPIAWLTTGEGAAFVNKYAAKEHLDVVAAIFQLFGRQTVQRFVNEVTTNAPQFARTRALYPTIPSVEEQYRLLQEYNYETNIEDIQKAWKGFMEALGDPGIKTAITILQLLTGALHEFTAAIEAHPDAARRILKVSAALATIIGVLAGGGAVAAILRLAGIAAPKVAAEVAVPAAARAAAMGIGSLTALGSAGLIGGAAAAITAWYISETDSAGGENVNLSAVRNEMLRQTKGLRDPNDLDRSEWRELHRIRGGGTASWGSENEVSHRPIQLQGVVNIDGKKLGDFMATQLNKPQSTPGFPVIAASPYMPVFGQ